MNLLHVVFVLVSLVGFSSQAQQAQGVPKKAPAREGQPASQPERQQYPTENSPLPIRVIESPSDEADRKSRETEAAKHENADLKAQERSAGAAEDQVRVGTAMAWLSLFGLAALIWTLYETRRSASAATRAAGAAELAVSNAKDSAEKQLRAYINVTTVSVRWKIDHPDVTIKLIQVQVDFKNSGQTPANMVCGWTLAHSRSPDDLDFPLGVGAAQAVQAAGSTDHFACLIEVNHPEGVINAWKNGTKRLYVFGWITYVDCFKKERRTTFRLVMPPEGIDESAGFGKAGKGKFMQCPEGNDAD